MALMGSVPMEVCGSLWGLSGLVRFHEMPKGVCGLRTHGVKAQAGKLGACLGVS